MPMFLAAEPRHKGDNGMGGAAPRRPAPAVCSAQRCGAAELFAGRSEWNGAISLGMSVSDGVLACT
ncbi:hypothetical protein GCM10022206_82580 [Streptomyces chiangmaiensis]